MRSLDFLVIGAQKAGTTSLWQYLRRHPRVYLPSFKEAAIFTAESAIFDRFAEFMRPLFADASPAALLGTITPDYMIGAPGIGVEVVAERIASKAPAARLIALLRDPVERAISSYMMAVRRGQEERSVDAVLSDLLEPGELANARLRPSPSNSCIVAGEYGRVLGAYRAIFPAEQLLTLFTEDLASDPGALLDTTLGFLGLPAGFRPEGLGDRHFRSGTRKLLDPGSERLLRKFHQEEVLPHMRGSPLFNSMTFDFFYETWNIVPEDPPSISGHLRKRLEEHFRADAEKLTELGVRAPWIARWALTARSRRAGTDPSAPRGG